MLTFFWLLRLLAATHMALVYRLKADGEKTSRLQVEYQLVYVTSVNAFIKKAIERGKSCFAPGLHVIVQCNELALTHTADVQVLAMESTKTLRLYRRFSKTL